MVTALTTPHRGCDTNQLTAHHALVFFCGELFNQRTCLKNKTDKLKHRKTFLSQPRISKASERRRQTEILWDVWLWARWLFRVWGWEGARVCWDGGLRKKQVWDSGRDSHIWGNIPKKLPRIPPASPPNTRLECSQEKFLSPCLALSEFTISMNLHSGGAHEAAVVRCKKTKPRQVSITHGHETVLVDTLEVFGCSLNKDRLGAYHKPHSRVTRLKETQSLVPEAQHLWERPGCDVVRILPDLLLNTVTHFQTFASTRFQRSLSKSQV